MKLLGYCPSCGIGVAEHELGYNCMKCNNLLEREELRSAPPPPVTRQCGKEVAYNRLYIATKGIRTGAIPKTREELTRAQPQLGTT